MPTVYIAIGSNIDPELNIPASLGFLKSNGRITGVSTFYKTPPLNCPDSPPFYNGVIRLETCFEPRELKFKVLRRIEEALGRVRCEDKNAARPIDLDIAVYGSLAVNEPDLIIPDPEITNRAFIAVPLYELDKNLPLPGLDIDLSDIAKALDASDMEPLEEFSEALRQELNH